MTHKNISVAITDLRHLFQYCRSYKTCRLYFYGSMYTLQQVFGSVLCVTSSIMAYGRTPYVGMTLASYPGSRWAGKGEPGIHCLRMRLISQKSWEIGNYCVISVKPWRHNVHLPLHRPHIFWPTMGAFRSFVLLRPPVPSDRMVLLIRVSRKYR